MLFITKKIHTSYKKFSMLHLLLKYLKYRKTEVNVIKAGKHDLKLYIFTDADYTTEYVGSKLGEVPLNSERVYVQYKTSADQYFKV